MFGPRHNRALFSYGWRGNIGLTRFDYVLLRGPVAATIERDLPLRMVAKDDDFTLFSVCGGTAQPPCAAPATPKP